MKIILASTSKPRAQLLRQICPNFETMAPDVDESPLINETAHDLVTRLAQKKAEAIAAHHPEAIVIGADQVAWLNQKIQGKLHTFEAAKKWLEQASGETAEFVSGMAITGPNHSTEVTTTITRVKYRKLSSNQIDYYLKKPNLN